MTQSATPSDHATGRPVVFIHTNAKQRLGALVSAHSFRRKREDRADVVFGVRAAFVSCDDDGDFAEDVARARRELSQCAAAHLLVVFGELAAQGCAARCAFSYSASRRVAAASRSRE